MSGQTSHTRLVIKRGKVKQDRHFTKLEHTRARMLQRTKNTNIKTLQRFKRCPTTSATTTKKCQQITVRSSLKNLQSEFWRYCCCCYCCYCRYIHTHTKTLFCTWLVEETKKMQQKGGFREWVFFMRMFPAMIRF